VESGCDYITATAARKGPSEALYEFGHYLVREQAQNGSKVRQTKTGGYHTQISGSVSIGRRYDGVCLRASAHVAHEHWNQIADIAERITRFDVQATDVTSSTPAQRLAQFWRRNPGRTTGEGRRSEVKKLVGPNGCEMIRVASRQSDRFLRLYDKWLDTQQERYRNSLRAELEMKGDIANSYVVQLTLDSQPEKQMLFTLHSYLTSKCRHSTLAGYLRGFDGHKIMCRRAPEPAQDNIRTLRYLASAIKPSVERLIKAGWSKEVYEALGLPDREQSE
jgi:hypothetical protein